MRNSQSSELVRSDELRFLELRRRVVDVPRVAVEEVSTERIFGRQGWIRRDLAVRLPVMCDVGNTGRRFMGNNRLLLLIVPPTMLVLVVVVNQNTMTVGRDHLKMPKFPLPRLTTPADVFSQNGFCKHV